MRVFSQSEAAALYDCQARHDFAYGGKLAGAILDPKVDARPLTMGTIWGRANIVWHRDGLDAAIASVSDLVAAEIDRQRSIGMLTDQGREELSDIEVTLVDCLDHWDHHMPRLQVTHDELELTVSIPSRSGKRGSTRYRYRAHLDGVVTDGGRTFILENKLRMNQLMPLADIQAMRQLRWYAWVYQQHTGQSVAGVIYDERIAQAPQQPRVLKNGRVSNDRRQMVTAESYRLACEAFGQEPDTDTIAHLEARRWQQRQVITFTESDMRDAGREIVSTARLLGMLDRGDLEPVRNASRFRCPSCPFREACADPTDTDLISALYERRQPNGVTHRAA